MFWVLELNSATNITSLHSTFVEYATWKRKTKVNNVCLSFSRCILRIKTTVSNCVKYVPFESPAHEVASCMGRGQQIYQPLPEHPGSFPLLIQKHRKGARWGCTGPFNFSLASPFHLMGGGGGGGEPFRMSIWSLFTTEWKKYTTCVLALHL